MKRILLQPKIKIQSELDLRNLSNIDFGKKNSINSIKILYQNREKKLKDLFDLKFEDIKKKECELVFRGLNKYCNYLGWKWKKNILRINSNVGSFLGAKMEGGKIFVNGSAENHVGSEMKNGTIFIKFNVSDFVGASLPGGKGGMSGGTIIIYGEAKDYLGLNMRRGIIYVNSDAGNFSCNNMVAGTVILKKNVGESLGLGMKRGTIFLNRKSYSNKCFKESGGLSDSFFGLLYNYFLKKHGIKFFDKDVKLKRFCIDSKIDEVGELFIKE